MPRDLHIILNELSSYVDIDGSLPSELFYFVSKYFGECCLELCIFSNINNEPNIYLYPRPRNDPFWPSKLHIPGTRKLKGDTDLVSLIRVIRETPLDIRVEDIKYVNSDIIHNPRGTEYSDLRMVEYKGIPNSCFMKIDDLDKLDIIDYQKVMIRSAYKIWRENV